jgi:anti-sigma28 factor (negative regulator of flagellin synthesis)
MKIPGSDSTISQFGLVRSPTVGSNDAGSAIQQPAGGASPSDQEQISSLGRFLATALSGSPVHLAKVSELSAAVSSGKYHVDAYAVSASIIQNTIEFGGAGY